MKVTLTVTFEHDDSALLTMLELDRGNAEFGRTTYADDDVFYSSTPCRLLSRLRKKLGRGINLVVIVLQSGMTAEPTFRLILLGPSTFRTVDFVTQGTLQNVNSEICHDCNKGR